MWFSGFPKAVASLSALDSVLSLLFFRVSFAQILASENFTLACPSPGNCPAVHSWEQPIGLTWFSFDCIKKSDYPERTHTGRENMQRPHSKTPNGQQIQTQLVTAAVKDLVSFCCCLYKKSCLEEIKATSNLIHLAMLKRDDMHRLKRDDNLILGTVPCNSHLWQIVLWWFWNNRIWIAPTKAFYRLNFLNVLNRQWEGAYVRGLLGEA